MRTGVFLPNSVPGTTGRQLLDWATTAEQRGFDSVGVIDRVVYDSYEPLVALSLAAAVTERVELVTSLLISPLRNDGILAKQADSLDRASGGRLTLGIGVGLREDDFRACDINFHVRGAKLDQHMRQLAGHRLLVGGDAQHAARRLRTGGDGWTMMIGTPDQFAAGMTLVDNAWDEAGRAGRPRAMAVFYAALGDDAETLARTAVHGYYAWLGPEICDAIVASVATTPDAVRRYLDAFEQAGATDVLICPCSNDLTQLELLADAALRTPALV
jgi:alkanesulfonate monooxygenase SsuD/methylene tetrahydromethanopterin reductase-like flavin-dependent oxidoreductase (luciferase family)